MEMIFLISCSQNLDSIFIYSKGELGVAVDDEIPYGCVGIPRVKQDSFVISYPPHRKLDLPESLPKRDSWRFCLDEAPRYSRKFCLAEAPRKLSAGSEKWGKGRKESHTKTRNPMIILPRSGFQSHNYLHDVGLNLYVARRKTS